MRERKRERESGGQVEGEGDTESDAGSRIQAVSIEPDVGLELTNREITIWAKVGTLNQLSHTGAPEDNFLWKLS